MTPEDQETVNMIDAFSDMKTTQSVAEHCLSILKMLKNNNLADNDFEANIPINDMCFMIAVMLVAMQRAGIAKFQFCRDD